jgi:hypothetical protein
MSFNLQVVRWVFAPGVAAHRLLLPLEAVWLWAAWYLLVSSGQFDEVPLTTSALSVKSMVLRRAQFSL